MSVNRYQRKLLSGCRSCHLKLAMDFCQLFERIKSMSPEFEERGDIKSMNGCRFLGAWIVAFKQRHDRQHAETDNREDFERVEIGLGARLHLHHLVDTPQSLMAGVDSAHAGVERVIGKPGELVAERGVEGAYMHAEGVLVYLRPPLGQSRHHRDADTGSNIAKEVYHARNLIVLPGGVDRPRDGNHSRCGKLVDKAVVVDWRHLCNPQIVADANLRWGTT